MTLPTKLTANAWSENGPVGASNLDVPDGSLAEQITKGAAPLKPAALPDLANWRDERVGWGLVLPENEELSASERATPKDCPEPIQRLWEHRAQAPVLRYDPARGSTVAALRRYYDDGSHDPDLVGSGRGTGRGQSGPGWG